MHMRYSNYACDRQYLFAIVAYQYQDFVWSQGTYLLNEILLLPSSETIKQNKLLSLILDLNLQVLSDIQEEFEYDNRRLLAFEQAFTFNWPVKNYRPQWNFTQCVGFWKIIRKNSLPLSSNYRNRKALAVEVQQFLNDLIKEKPIYKTQIDTQSLRDMTVDLMDNPAQTLWNPSVTEIQELKQKRDVESKKDTIWKGWDTSPLRKIVEECWKLILALFSGISQEYREYLAWILSRKINAENMKNSLDLELLEQTVKSETVYCLAFFLCKILIYTAGSTSSSTTIYLQETLYNDTIKDIKYYCTVLAVLSAEIASLISTNGMSLVFQLLDNFDLVGPLGQAISDAYIDLNYQTNKTNPSMQLRADFMTKNPQWTQKPPINLQLVSKFKFITILQTLPTNYFGVELPNLVWDQKKLTYENLKPRFLKYVPEIFSETDPNLKDPGNLKGSEILDWVAYIIEFLIKHSISYFNSRIWAEIWIHFQASALLLGRKKIYEVVDRIRSLGYDIKQHSYEDPRIAELRFRQIIECCKLFAVTLQAIQEIEGLKKIYWFPFDKPNLSSTTRASDSFAEEQFALMALQIECLEWSEGTCFLNLLLQESEFTSKLIKMLSYNGETNLLLSDYLNVLESDWSPAMIQETSHNSIEFVQSGPQKKNEVLASFGKLLSSCEHTIDIMSLGDIAGPFALQITDHLKKLSTNPVKVRIFIATIPEKEKKLIEQAPWYQKLYGALDSKLENWSTIQSEAEKWMTESNLAHDSDQITTKQSQDITNKVYQDLKIDEIRKGNPNNFVYIIGAGRALCTLKLIAIWGWNHQKIVVIDGGRKVLSGGMNLNQDSLDATANWRKVPLTDEDTVNDFSLLVEGQAACSAQVHIDNFWTNFNSKTVNTTSNNPDFVFYRVKVEDKLFNYVIKTNQNTKIFDNNIRNEWMKKHEALGFIPMWSVGRRAGYPIDNKPSDIALVYLIKIAKKEIQISQQSLYYPTNFSVDWAFSWPAIKLALKLALYRGVKISILLCRVNDKNDSEDGGYTSASADEVMKDLLSNPKEYKLDPSLLEVRNLKTKNNNPGRNHAKVIIVDRECAYVGSQNLYACRMTLLKDNRIPSSFKGLLWGEANLGEFGYIISHKETAQKLKELYFDPLWNQSKL